jgi:solute carrier family 10 (sodium/bile acid cotransporter), member 7
VFCRQFNKGGEKTGFGAIAIIILFIFLNMVTCMTLAWYIMKLLFKDEPGLRVMGVFGCTQKTIALGIPLISTIFAKDPNLTLYTLPILIWHPMQLVVGSTIVPRLQKFIASENVRLGLPENSQYFSTATITADASPVTQPVTAAADERV